MENSADSESVESLPPGLSELDEPVLLLDEVGAVRNCNDAFQTLTERSRGELLGTASKTLIAEQDERLGTAIEQAIETGSATVEVTLESEGRIMPLDCSLSTLPDTEGVESAVICIGHQPRRALDGVHRERTRRQGAIETLQDATERIQQAETVEDVARVAVEATTVVFDLPYAICWFHDAETEQLEPKYATDEAHEEEFVGSFSPGSYEYDIFQRGDPTSYSPQEVAEDNSLSNALLFPLGDHGMIGVGGEQEYEFDETVVDLSRTLAEHTTTALERVTRTQQLREERALTESIFVALPDVFYAFNEQGEFFRWNDQLSAVTGYTDEEIESMHPAEFFPPEDRERIYEAIADVFQNDTTITIEAQFETKDGERIPYEFTGAKLTDETGESLGLVGIGRDISERKQQQRRFEAVFNNTYQFTGLMKPDGTVIEANETALEFVEVEPDAVIGEKVWNSPWFTHSQAARYEAKTAVEQAAEGNFARTEVTIQGADREAIIDFSVRPVTDENGDITLLIPEGRDITELKERERELRRERDHIRRTEAQADVGGWEVNLDAETLYWTDGLRDLYDVSSSFEPRYEDAIGYFHPESRERVSAALEACRIDGTPFDIEAQILTAAGRTRWAQIEGERVGDGDATKLRGVVRDITDRKEREQRLMVLNRVLRHNLRNKLTVVTGYADHVESKLEELAVSEEIEPTEARERLCSFPLDDALTSIEEIQASSGDLTELSQKVRKFGETIERVDITDSVAVRPVVTDLGAEYTDEYPAARIDLDVDEISVKGNREFLRLAVGELVENAIQHSDRPEPSVQLSVTADAEDRVTIRVADDGPGIPDIEREVLREGEEGSLLHGSGIGLWTIHWLVTRVGGNVSIEDTEPTGTVVTLTIPQATES